MEKKTIELWKKILIGALILFLIIGILIVRKFIIITKLVNISKEYENKTNYYVISSSIQKDMMLIQKSYNRDGNFLTETKFYGKTLDDVITFTSYKSGNDELGIVQRGANKEIKAESILKSKAPIISVYSYFGDRTIENIKEAATSRITTKDYNGKECYLIESDMLTLWVDKDTGLVYRQINGGFGLTEFIYEFDVVNDIKRPQI